MTLATCAGGLPWATDVYFAPNGFELVFFSSPRSRHCLNLTANPACAATIHPQVDSWREIRGLQIEGEAGPPADTLASARAMAAYVKKFPFTRDLLAHPAQTLGAFSRAAAHVLRPSRLLYLDNAQGIGTRFSLRLVDGRPVGPPQRQERE